MKKTEMRITERKTKKIGLVVNGLSPKIGGRLKSTALGGLKPSPSANRITGNPFLPLLVQVCCCLLLYGLLLPARESPFFAPNPIRKSPFPRNYREPVFQPEWGDRPHPRSSPTFPTFGQSAAKRDKWRNPYLRAARGEPRRMCPASDPEASQFRPRRSALRLGSREWTRARSPHHDCSVGSDSNFPVAAPLGP